MVTLVKCIKRMLFKQCCAECPLMFQSSKQHAGHTSQEHGKYP